MQKFSPWKGSLLLSQLELSPLVLKTQQLAKNALL